MPIDPCNHSEKSELPAFLQKLRHSKLTSIIFFKLSWFFLVVFQNDGLLPALVLILFMVFLEPNGPRGMSTSLLIFASGCILDSALKMAGIFSFPAYTGLSLLPLWLIFLWFSFGLVMTSGFRFVMNYPLWVQSCSGALTGMSGYGAGCLLHAVEFPHSLSLTLLAVALLWAIFTPLWFSMLRYLSIRDCQYV